MGRPGTPGPSDGGESSENKATFSATVVLLSLLSFILAVVAVAVPYWGYFQPPGAGLQYRSSHLDGSGFFGPFAKCAYINNGYSKQCGSKSARYQTHVYLKVGGVCAIVGAVSTGLFCIFAGLHCMMQINNKNICIKYKQNILIALVTAIIADIATIAAVGISAPQFADKTQQYEAQLGPCYFIEITLVVFNLLLVVLAYVSYKKAVKTNFPVSRGPAYVISPEQYGAENFAGPQHGDRGITVTQSSGVHYTHQHQDPGQVHNQLPPYPAPTNGHSYYPSNGHAPNGYPQQGQVAQPQPQSVSLLQQQRAFVPMRVESPMGVSSNPMGRGGRGPSGAGGGSMDTLNTTDDTNSVLSFGSTGSYSSAASINNPIRSSLKRPKNKETASVASNKSGKSVRIALNQEQTAV